MRQPLLLLHLAVHAGSGRHNLTLLRLVELVLVARKDEADGRLSWHELVDLGAAAGLLGFAFPALALCEKLVPDTIPAWVLDRSASSAPPAVRKFVAGLRPGTAQRIGPASLREHYVWSQGARGHLRQFCHDIAPGSVSIAELAAIYRRRGWQLVRARATPQA